MPKIIKQIPKPTPTLYTIADLTSGEMITILNALKDSSGGNWERRNGYGALTIAGSRFGKLYNTLSPIFAYPEVSEEPCG